MTVHPKQAAAECAAGLVEDGMIVGLGTGSTAAYAIRRIGERVREGLRLHAVASSGRSERLARQLGIPIVPFSAIGGIDLTIDGADEIDPAHDLIKGGGGALLREKILAASSKRFVVVADDSKLVGTLGAFPLPVEIVPFAENLTLALLAELGCIPELRRGNGQGGRFVTDNGNLIADCRFGRIPDPAALGARINAIPGVAEHGLFVGMADLVVAAGTDGVRLLHKSAEYKTGGAT